MNSMFLMDCKEPNMSGNIFHQSWHVCKIWRFLGHVQIMCKKILSIVASIGSITMAIELLPFLALDLLLGLRP